jgi:hypothetical protein
MSVNTIEELADEVTRMLLSEDTSTSKQLREQYEASDFEIERSESGFFVHFDLPDDVEPIEAEKRIIIRGVYATMDGLDYGIDFNLFVDDGVISMLEGYTHQEEFPSDVESLHGVQLEESDIDTGGESTDG